MSKFSPLSLNEKSLGSVRVKDYWLLVSASNQPGTRMQATVWWGETSRRSGSMREQSGMASGQRVWKRQPEGGLMGVGTSPFKTIRSRLRVGSGTGMAESRARV